jgi:hypothetical protein
MSNDPVLFAYTAKRSAKTGRINYTRIGRAYPHDTGQGLTIVFDAWPLNPGPIILLELDGRDHRHLHARAKRLARERSSMGKPRLNGGGD